MIHPFLYSIKLYFAAAITLSLLLQNGCQKSTPVKTEDSNEFKELRSLVEKNQRASNYATEIKTSSDLITIALQRGNEPITISTDHAQLITNHLPSPIDERAVEALLPDNYTTTKKLYVVDTGRDLRFFFSSSATAVLGSDINTAYNPPLPKIGTNQKLNVLMIGNSLTSDTAEHLPRIFHNLNISNVNLSEIYHGGFTLQQHNANFDTANQCCHYIYNAGAADWAEFDPTALDDCAADVLATRCWDIVTIQEHTGNEAAWSWTAAEKEAIIALIDRIYNAQPTHRPTIVYLLSHVYGRSFYKDTTLWDSFDGDQNKMYEKCVERIGHILTETPIDLYFSNATAVQNLRTSALNENHPLDLSRDCIHSDYGITRFCESATCFQAIFAPCLGRDLSELTYTYSKSDMTPGNYTTPVTNENRQIAIAAAKNAIAHPLQITRMGSGESTTSISYLWRLSDNVITMPTGATCTISEVGSPVKAEWTISGTGCGLATYPFVQSPANNRYKVGTGGDYISPFIIKSRAFADKTITRISVCASLPDAKYSAHIKASVGNTVYIDSDVALSTTSVKLTGHNYAGTGSASGDITVEITCNGPFYIYTLSVDCK